MSEPVLVEERRGAVVVLRLNRPDARNALSPELASAIGVALEDAECVSDVRCVVLTGAGDRAFCAGMDLRAFGAGDTFDTGADRGMEAFTRLLRGGANVPVVGAANGSAVAGGFELLLGCDVVVASEEAKFGLPEVKRGLFPAGGGVLLGTRIPLAIALELTLTGDPIGAERAYALGLVNEVVAAPEVLDAAMRKAERIAANGPLAVEGTRAMVRAAVTDVKRAETLQAEWGPKIFGSDDAKEGAAAFVERRAPVWRGQ